MKKPWKIKLLEHLGRMFANEISKKLTADMYDKSQVDDKVSNLN